MRRKATTLAAGALAACLTTAGCEPGAKVASRGPAARASDTAGGVLVVQEPVRGPNVVPGGGPRVPPSRTGAVPPDSSTACVVRSVTDGDTVRCRDGRRVRLLLIDAPERTQPPYAERSRDALVALAPPGTRLRLELDVRPVDRYGRTLAYLWRTDGRMVNREMVRGGWAVVLVYPPNVRHVEPMRAAADSARRERRGLHEVNGFQCAPVEHRRREC